MITKEDLKMLEGDSWKLVAFKQDDRTDQTFPKHYQFDSIFMLNKEHKVEIRLRYDPSINHVELGFVPSVNNETILVEGTRLTESIFTLFQTKTKNHRLTMLLNDLKVERSVWMVDLDTHEKPMTRSEIFGLKDALENEVNTFWKNASPQAKALRSFYVLGDKGSHAVELLSEEMLLMDFQTVGDGLYRLTMKPDVFPLHYTEKMAFILSSFLRKNGVDTIEL
jgi:hypothetical protein